MEWYYILLIILGSIIVVISLLFPFVLSYLLYSIHMVRTKPSKWDRKCSAPNNEEQVKMWNDGLNFISQFKDKIKEVHIQNDGLNLYGEYVDVGANRCVILLGGRCECLYYAYYYAKPYLENNCNVLVVDQRAHGKSQGKINTVGFNECNDIIKWAEFIHDTFNLKEIYLHGTCIGAATSIHALAKPNCPKYITKLITDGVYTTYYDTFKLHMVEQKRPLWPALDLCFVFYKLCAKIDAKNIGPINLVDKIDENVSVMMISGLKDKYVSPEKTKMMFDKLKSKNKEYHYLKEGNHSHLRINQIEEYDKLVIDFIGK